MRVHKYVIETVRPHEIVELKMPKDARILHAGADTRSENIAIWALVDPRETQQKTKRFAVVGTGWDFPYPIDNMDDVKFIGALRRIHLSRVPANQRCVMT